MSLRGTRLEIEPALLGSPVFRLRETRRPLGLPPYTTAAYWVDGLLIDTGCAHAARQLATVLKEWRINQVVNTHSHEDHIGANAEIQSDHGCAILAHPGALPILEGPETQALQAYRRLFWGMPRPSHGEVVGQYVTTSQYCFQVIPTPGHSQDHICLFEPDQGWLFSGDAYIGGEDRALRRGFDIHQIIASLRQLSELPVKVIFSGSGSVRALGTEPLLDKIAHLEGLGRQVRALHAGGSSPRRIRRRLIGREPHITYLTLGHFSSMNLIRSYLSNGNVEAGERQAELPTYRSDAGEGGGGSR